MNELKERFCSFIMNIETMDSFLSFEKENGASDNVIRRLTCAIRSLYEFLPEDKLIVKDRLLEWRKSLEDNGYASMTVLNYVKYINKYLDYIGASDIRFNRGKAKNISGMTFGYLTAIEPTGTKNRKDFVWKCQCKCGKIVEYPATRLLTGNTMSCGCLYKEHFQRVNKYIDKTSIRQSLDDQVKSTRAKSGYVGVTVKKNKWQAYINYKGKHYSLGCYDKLEDAVDARAKYKQLVQEDAMQLLEVYEEIHQFDFDPPSRQSMPKIENPASKIKKNEQIGSYAKRTDNKSGYTGISKRRGLWEARICYRGVRYILGSFETIEDAVIARKQAERDLESDPEGFVVKYSQLYSHHNY